MNRKRKKIILGIGTLMMAAGITAQAEASEVTIDEKWVMTNQEASFVLDDSVREAFASVLEAQIQKLGLCETSVQEEKAVIYPGKTASGVCYAAFVDFEKDEVPELYLLSYDFKDDETQYLLEEIYRWDGKAVKSVFEEEHVGVEGEESITELYHESGPIGRYCQKVSGGQETETLTGTLYRMKSGEISQYFCVSAEKNGSDVSELFLEYNGEKTSYEEIADLEAKLRMIVGSNMRSKILSSVEEGKIIYDTFCLPVIYENGKVYARFNKVEEIYQFLQGTPMNVLPETEAPQTEPQTEAQTETTPVITEPQTEVPQTEAPQEETIGIEEMKYYLYIQSYLVPSYGLVTSSDMTVNDSGIIVSGSTRGVMSAVFSDVNADGQKEMILAYLKDDSQEYRNQVVFELYAIRYDEVIKLDDTIYYPADKQNQLSVSTNTQAYVKGKYLCVYTLGGSSSLSSRYTDLYVYDLSQNQITMIRDYDFMRVPGIVTMSEGVQQITYYSGDELQITEEQKTKTQQTIQAELNYFGISDLSVWVGDPMDQMGSEYQISGKKMWSSVGLDTQNFENRTIYFEDCSDLRKYVTPIQSQQTPQTEATNPSSEYILPGSDTHYLTQEEINSVPSNLLEYACNEIYARHGRRFIDSAFQNYFDSKSWYHGTIQPDQFDVGVFNAYETENIMRLVERMKQLGIR